MQGQAFCLIPVLGTIFQSRNPHLLQMRQDVKASKQICADHLDSSLPASGPTDQHTVDRSSFRAQLDFTDVFCWVWDFCYLLFASLWDRDELRKITLCTFWQADLQ